MSTPEGYRYRQTLEARFGDTDMFGHVNNAKFLTYMEHARLQYFEDVIGGDRKAGKESVILAKVTCTYKKPLFFKDVVDVWVRVVRLGNKSFDQEYQLIRQADGAVVGIGHAVLVAYDYHEGQAIPVPDAWRERVIAYEPALDG